jgi:4-amino-4-deoxy-L-arabinose transferase-like glycosyltransferase
MHKQNDLLKRPSQRSGAPDSRNGTHTHVAILTAFVLVAIVIRTLPLTYSHFWDETVFLQHARILVDGRTNYDEFFHRPPLLPFMYAVGYTIWDSIFVANIVQGILSGLMVLFAFLYVRSVFGAIAGLAAAALFAFTPYVVVTSHELLTDAPAVTLMLAAMWLFDKPGARWALFAGFVFALAVQMRYTSIFLACYLVLDAVIAPRKLRHLLLAGASAALTVTPYLLWNYSRFGSPVYPFELARRIVHEWTAPMPAVFYFRALAELFPPTIWALFALGVAQWLWRRWLPADASLRPSELRDPEQTKRQVVLLIWGVAFFAYMLSIPHKEVRYLLPLTIPVLVLAGVTLAEIASRAAALRQPFQIATLALALLIATVDFGEALAPVVHDPVDRSLSNEVEIALYLREHSSPKDAIYAAHNFPVYAFYTERRTVSLLPIQADFDDEWQEWMKQPGFLVYTHPDRLGEIHAIAPALKPDRNFLDTHPAFHAVQDFATVTVYRYDP